MLASSNVSDINERTVFILATAINWLQWIICWFFEEVTSAVTSEILRGNLREVGEVTMREVTSEVTSGGYRSKENPDSVKNQTLC